LVVGVLDRLVAPLPAGTFLAEHWPLRPWWTPPAAARVELFDGISELESAPAVFKGAARVSYFKPDGTTGEVGPDKAHVVYGMGLTCFLGCAHLPAVMEAAEGLAADLGLPSGSVTAEVFCSDGDAGAPLHSDHDANFAVLLRGQKTWQIAENRHIRNQTALCRPNKQEEHDPTQLELADQLPFPDALPRDAIAVDVDAGGALFLPRGWWHQTTSRGECLQVNLVVNRPMWVTALTRALERRLLRDPEWRAYTYDVFTSGERRAAAIDRFAGLLEGLRAELGAEDSLELAEALLEDSGLKPAQPYTG
jgi:50S ribosomal protein L16 3-hydroxylase